jgi:hypothetical protein
LGRVPDENSLISFLELIYGNSMAIVIDFKEASAVLLPNLSIPRLSGVEDRILGSIDALRIFIDISVFLF